MVLVKFIPARIMAPFQGCEFRHPLPVPRHASPITHHESRVTSHASRIVIRWLFRCNPDPAGIAVRAGFTGRNGGYMNHGSERPGIVVDGPAKDGM